MAKGPTETQRKILRNASVGRALDYNRPIGRSAAGGWSGAVVSCYQRGWLKRPGIITDAGREAIGLPIGEKNA